MNNLIFSQAAVFHLHQLGSQLYHLTGTRYKLSTPEGILDLLRNTTLSRDKNIRTRYDAFVLELNKRQLDALAAHGVAVRPPLSLTKSALYQAS